MGDELKSAFEIAMERLKAKDSDGEAPQQLTKDQKEQIAEIRREFEAKRAEVEIAFNTAQPTLLEEGNPEKIAAAEHHLRSEKARLSELEEERVAQVRGS